MDIHERLERSSVAKAVLAVLIFGLIFGGWFALERHRALSATLPNPPQRPEACALWFVGSSSIHRWTTLDRDMAPWRAYNRGIDNSIFAAILPRFGNAADDARPVAIILYAGENDIARDIPVRAVIRNLAAFLDLRARIMAGVPVLVLSMKPSPGRRAYLREQRLYNDAARRLITGSKGAYFADITTPLLKGGKMGDYYRADEVHMNAAGYRIWAGVVRQRLREALPAATIARCEASR
ncbi:GDSL-type esterase/lipase family protein [Sphingobium mellinum]|uniref:GDSL-type esterase/lipase family protein n=1 Tax=Sphingobium mellinum TaxID=1387166 RepID=UPI0030EEDB6F